MKSVVIQGIKGSFHHEAVVNFFKDKEVNIIDSPTFNTLVKKVSEREVDYGMIAIENSIAGAILPNYTLITKNKLHIIGEIVLPIKHNLLSLESDTLESIEEIQTHPMALLQCELFLAEYPDWKLLAKGDTASCAKNIYLKQKYGVATIGSKLAARLYNLKVLKENIHDVPDNFTRFYLLSSQKSEIKDFNKASFYFTTDHKMGSLSKVLNVLVKYGFNMTKIQSVPASNSVFQYSFHVDITLTPDSYENYYKALEEMRVKTVVFTVLGEYKEYNI